MSRVPAESSLSFTPLLDDPIVVEKLRREATEELNEAIAKVKAFTRAKLRCGGIVKRQLDVCDQIRKVLPKLLDSSLLRGLQPKWDGFSLALTFPNPLPSVIGAYLSILARAQHHPSFFADELKEGTNLSEGTSFSSTYLPFSRHLSLPQVPPRLAFTHIRTHSHAHDTRL
jgi:hypothetical protein